MAARPRRTPLRSAPVVPPRSELAELIGLPVEEWRGQCHAVSYQIVKRRIIPGGRVARGWASGVIGQHSWIIVGDDPYDPRTPIVDPTLWCYTDAVSDVLVTTAGARIHRAHGLGPHIMEVGRPDYAIGPVIKLSPPAFAALSADAKWWMTQMLDRLDRRGWMELTSMTMVGWPAGEVMAAMNATPELSALVPIDLLGMLTSLNPGGVWLPPALDTAEED